ncbi:avirulence protein 1b [Phytophthora cinnamomi]|uniref:avirulence protein 1b n=1 Tax=Phytophthora cinnamomi TaxID=4785 RepID=UPI00355A3BC0|nr:avirulence protein 1b [Phytophthora cinnamomi]
MSKVISADQDSVLHDLVGGMLNGRRLLRTQPTGDDDDASKSKYDTSDAAKTKDDDSDDSVTAKSGKSNPKNGEERGIIVDGLYQQKYEDWFDEGKTPSEVADDLGLDDYGLFENPLKRRIYQGYKLFYDDACEEPRNRRFCRENDGNY